MCSSRPGPSTSWDRWTSTTRSSTPWASPTAFGQAITLVRGDRARDGAGAGAAAPARWLDLGSGGGLPGLVLAQHWPSAPGVLLDSAARRTSFLSHAVETHGVGGPRPGRPGPGRGCRFDPRSPGEVRRGLGEVVRESSRRRRMCRPIPRARWPPGGVGASFSWSDDRPVATTGVGRARPGAAAHGPGPVRLSGSPAGGAVPGSLSPAVRGGGQAAPVPGLRGVIEKAPFPSTRVRAGQGTENANVPRVTLR